MTNYSPENLKRLILKISGEYLAGKSGFGFDEKILQQVTDDIIEVKDLGYELGIIIGGGNLCRGKELDCIPHVAADNVGMLATLQNAIVVSEILKQKNQKTQIFTAFHIEKMGKLFTYQSADKALRKGKICFLSGGTGNPFFTTDTAAILRAIELKADLVLKGTKVDGIYTADPHKHKDATFIKNITYAEALAKRLNIMDMTAFSLASDYHISLKIFDVTKPGNIKKAILSADVGSYISN